MTEGIIMPLAKSIVDKIASFTSDLVISSVSEEIRAAKSAKKDLKLIADKLEAICAVLEDAEDRQYSNKAIKIWIRDLKSVVYDIDDLLDEVSTDALQRRLNKGHFCRQLRYYLSSSNPLISYFDLSHKVKTLREKLGNIVAKKNEFGLTERPVQKSSHDIRDPLDRCAYVCERAIIGRDDAKCDILSKLSAISNQASEADSGISVLPIVGMGGIGKTSVAKLVHRDACNFDIKLWACVSDKFQIQKILEDIVKDGIGDKNLSNHDLNTWIKKLHDLLDGKKYFLVLDDVWEEDITKWTQLKNLLTIGKPGSVILITTRSERVASITGTVELYNLNSLPFDVCWSIFKQLAFKEGEEERYPDLVEIGRLIVEKCKGIPLVVQSLGSLLRFERDAQQWQNIQNMDSFVGLHGQYDKVMSLLKLSYNKLPSHLKPCFAYLSLFVKDVELRVDVMIEYWSALGLLQLTHGETELESIGHSYFLELVSRSLLHEHEFLNLNNILFSECKIHDMLHDLALNILEEEICVVTRDKMKVSPYTRHVIWGYEGSNSLKETTFSTELSNAPNIRTFMFHYRMDYISSSILEGVISTFNCLRILDLSSSSYEELPKTIGNLKHLRILDLSLNYIIKSLPNSICKLINLEKLDVHGCERLQKLPERIYLLPSLRSLLVTTCQMSLATKFNELSSLQFLVFYTCENLTALWDDGNVGRLTSLQYLGIYSCPNLRSLPNSMKFLTRLNTLIIHDCEKLDLENGESLQSLQRLEVLGIGGVPKFKRLPHGIQSAAASLQLFTIQNCQGLVELPEWLQCFTSLRKIMILECPNILALPKALSHLHSLQELRIEGCSHLSKRCVVPTGEDYSLIRHIPLFKLDGVEHIPDPNQ